MVLFFYGMLAQYTTWWIRKPGHEWYANYIVDHEKNIIYSGVTLGFFYLGLTCIRDPSSDRPYNWIMMTIITTTFVYVFSYGE